MKILLLVVALALFAAATAAPGDVRWGQFRIGRLKEKLAEDKTDLAETKKELAQAKSFATKSIQTSKQICGARIRRASLAVAEWKAIVALRGGAVRYHKRRHPKYTAAHEYAMKGPKRFRIFLRTCFKPSTSRSACAQQWAKANPRAFARWAAAHKEYVQGNYRKHLRKHKRTTDSHKKRARRAVAALRRARLHRSDLIKSCKQSIPKTAKRLSSFVGRFRARVAALSTQIKTLGAAFTQLKAQRAAREKKYQKFYMTACKHIGGKHHVYYCLLDTNNSNRKEHAFLHCQFRRRSPKFVSKMFFHCTK